MDDQNEFNYFYGLLIIAAILLILAFSGFFGCSPKKDSPIQSPPPEKYQPIFDDTEEEWDDEPAVPKDGCRINHVTLSPKDLEEEPIPFLADFPDAHEIVEKLENKEESKPETQEQTSQI